LRGLNLPTAARGWSLFGATLLLSPTLALIFESLAVGVVILFFIMYSNYQPALHPMLKTLFTELQNPARDNDQVIQSIAKFLFVPGTAITFLATFSVIIPLIEETLKIIMILPLLNQIQRLSDGYILGIFCGAAFALAENIGFASAGSNEWMISALTRATTALPHIFNSGLLGWAVVLAWKKRKFGILFIALFASVLVHGTWNAISLGLAMNDLSPYISKVPLFFQNSYPWISGWIVMTVGVFVGLNFNNFQIRKLMRKEDE
jgi:RsiW-degrading membrane proteinase PrsW (M82 family)